MLAHPLETIHLKQVADPLARIAEIVARDGVGTIVLGMPRNMDGT
jgi:RNase H-fold protein (predicted Holliday junction resolvase)